jgi:hypothetical protein
MDAGGATDVERFQPERRTPVAFERRTYETRQEKRRDFWIGFGGWFAVNIALAMLTWGCTALISYLAANLLPPSNTIDTLAPLLVLILQIIPLLINLGGLIFLGFTRQWIALGALAAFGAALLLVVVAGVCFVVICFTLLFTSY